MSTKQKVQALSVDIEGKRQLCGSLAERKTVLGEKEGRFGRDEGETAPR